MENFKRTVYLGTSTSYRKNGCRVYVRIEYKDGRLSIHGSEGRGVSGFHYGQMHDDLLAADRWSKIAPGIDYTTIKKLVGVWRRWHLNDMRAGTPAQEQAIRDFKKQGGVFNPMDHYTAVCAYLEGLGLLVDEGYKYGSAWLKEEVPADVLDWLKGLPQAEEIPSWV